MATVLETFGPQELHIPEEIAAKVVNANLCADEPAFFEALAWMRANRPIGWASLPGYDPIWIISRYADVVAVERRADVFLNMVDNPIFNPQADDAFLKEVNNGTCQVVAALTHMDNPDHKALRAIATPYFTPARVNKLEADVRAIARDTVAKLLAGPREIDFVKDFALEYPLRVIMSMFGVPDSDLPRMLKLTQEFFGFKDSEEQRDDLEITADMAARQFHRVIQDYYDYFTPMTRDRRANPRDDLMSVIANSEVDGEPISDFFANGYYITIATAGHDTTSSTTATGMKALCENPDQFARLKADPSLIPTFVDEAIRVAAPVRHFTRTAIEDAEVAGITIRKGQRLMLSYPSASRDEAMFPDGGAFDLARKPNRHLAFGSGPHMCLGQHLAKLEIRILYEELLPHLTAVRLTGAPRYIETNFVGGLKSLPVAFETN
ncbi:cytochrome P450 [Novosphingobium colocasiae]|uniref:cytochrome P450 n=1 Tax=Novosphingobium colocasiae TaxID=1256513 RepID=UPI0035AFD09A